MTYTNYPTALLADKPGLDPDKIGYSDRWEAYYYKPTGEWLEETCGDSRCDYCEGRPEKMFFLTSV